MNFRKTTLLNLAICCSFSVVSIAQTKSADKQTVASNIPAKIHVIQNFEGWNDVLIRFSGVLRNSCYSKGETRVQVTDYKIQIQNMIKNSGGESCLMVISPYSGQIAVRDLKEGTYDVSVMDENGQYQVMTTFKTE